MKNKLIFTLISILLIVTTALTGCSSSAPNAKEAASNSSTSDQPAADQPIEIQFLQVYNGFYGDTLNKMIDAYHKSQNKVRVKPIFVDNYYDGIVERLQTLAVSKQLPDVVISGLSYNNYIISNMPLVPVQQFMDSEKMDTSDFYPGLLNLGKDNTGKIYGIPFAISTPIVYFNTDNFKTAGLDPANPPKTFDEWRLAAKKLTKGDQYGIYIPQWIWPFQSFVESFGGKMMSEDYKTVTFNQEPGIRALKYLTDLVNTDKTMPNLSGDQVTQSFQSGKISIYIESSASLRELQKGSKFEIGTAPFPVDGSNPRRVAAGGNSLYIMKSTPEKEKAAWDFVKFASSPEATAIIAEGMGYMAIRKSAVEREDLLGKYQKENPAANTSYMQSNDMVPWFNFPGKGGTKVTTIVGNALQASILKQKTPEQALNDAADETSKLLK